MAFKGHYLCVVVWAINGVKHVMRVYSTTPDRLKRHIDQILSHRRVTAPNEKTELINMQFGVTDEFAAKVEQMVRDENPDGTTAQDLADQGIDPAMLLHKPVAALVGESAGGTDDTMGPERE